MYKFYFSIKSKPIQRRTFTVSQNDFKCTWQSGEKNKFIHFAGSNGKGSTLNATREILMAHGLTVGAFISPHLERANERVTINKNQISDEDFLNIANQLSEVIKEKLDGKFPSFFEFMTLLALQYFTEQQVDVVLLETGIGGRLDSTNVVIPEVSVITTISLEHTDMLGESYGEIAAEKAGIIKTMKPVVVGVKNKEALSVIKETAIQLHAPIYMINEQFYIENNKNSNFDYVSDINISNITMAMIGEHQKENAALAITAVKLFLPSVDEKSKTSTS